MELLSGDVFLMRGDSKHSDYLAFAQRALYLKARSSHVLICVGDGAFIHSTTDGGVDFEFYEGALSKAKAGWQVIRKKGLSSTDRANLQKAALFFVDQAYNYKFLLKSNDSSSFCSELVAKIYERAQVPLFGKETGKVTPADFDRAADENNEWENVTDGYKSAFEEIGKDPYMHRFAYATLVATIRKRQTMMQQTDAIFGGLKTMAEKGEISQDFYNKAVAMEAAFRERKNISFWDEKKYSGSDEGS